MSDKKRPLELEFLNELYNDISLSRQRRRRSPGARRVTSAWSVDSDHPIVMRQQADHRMREMPELRAEAVDHQDGVAGSTVDIVNPRAVDIDELSGRRQGNVLQLSRP